MLRVRIGILRSVYTSPGGIGSPRGESHTARNTGGANFLLNHDIASAEYPNQGRISAAWFKRGSPSSYRSDVLETLDMLVALGYADDPRLAEAFRWLLNRQDAQGRWKLQNSLGSKMWAPIEQKGKRSKWITLRAMRVLKAAS